MSLMFVLPRRCLIVLWLALCGVRVAAIAGPGNSSCWHLLDPLSDPVINRHSMICSEHHVRISDTGTRSIMLKNGCHSDQAATTNGPRAANQCFLEETFELSDDFLTCIGPLLDLFEHLFLRSEHSRKNALGPLAEHLLSMLSKCGLFHSQSVCVFHRLCRFSGGSMFDGLAMPGAHERPIMAGGMQFPDKLWSSCSPMCTPRAEAVQRLPKRCAAVASGAQIRPKLGRI